MSWITVLPSHSCGGILQNLDIKLLHSSMQTSADHRSRRHHVSHMTDEKSETWSPSGLSKVRSRPESLVADCSMHVLQPPERRGHQGYIKGTAYIIVINYINSKTSTPKPMSSKYFKFCSVLLSHFSTLTHDIDIAILSVRLSVHLSVRNVLVSDKNGLTYCHSFFTIW